MSARACREQARGWREGHRRAPQPGPRRRGRVMATAKTRAAIRTRDTAAEVAFLTRALNAATLREPVARPAHPQVDLVLTAVPEVHRPPCRNPEECGLWGQCRAASICSDEDHAHNAELGAWASRWTTHGRCYERPNDWDMDRQSMMYRLLQG